MYEICKELKVSPSEINEDGQRYPEDIETIWQFMLWERHRAKREQDDDVDKQERDSWAKQVQDEMIQAKRGH